DGEPQAGQPVGRVVDTVAAAFQVLADHLGDAAIVLDQEDQSRLLFALFHCPSVSARRARNGCRRNLHICEGWRRGSDAGVTTPGLAVRACRCAATRSEPSLRRCATRANQRYKSTPCKER